MLADQVAVASQPVGAQKSGRSPLQPAPRRSRWGLRLLILLVVVAAGGGIFYMASSGKEQSGESGRGGAVESEGGKGKSASSLPNVEVVEPKRGGINNTQLNEVVPAAPTYCCTGGQAGRRIRTTIRLRRNRARLRPRLRPQHHLRLRRLRLRTRRLRRPHLRPRRPERGAAPKPADAGAAKPADSASGKAPDTGAAQGPRR